MHRARQHAAADVVACPADFAPSMGLSGDRETATAQAVAQAVVQAGCQRVIADRTLGLSYIEELARRGVKIEYDPDLGVSDRRIKSEVEIEHLRRAQAITERAVAMACELIGGAMADARGVLHRDGERLTVERVRRAVDGYLLDHNLIGGSIIAPGRQGADCHEPGRGLIHTGEPVIVDIFPCDRASGYHGDCTRTVVHGEVCDEIVAMHEAVVAAKHAASLVVRPGVSGQEVHEATIGALAQRGYAMGEPSDDQSATMTHGTGHGIGLDIHEPPLLDFKGPGLVNGDALTIEPGLYHRQLGGVRVEDMVIVSPGGCENLNTLPQGLSWGRGGN